VVDPEVGKSGHGTPIQFGNRLCSLQRRYWEHIKLDSPQTWPPSRMSGSAVEVEVEMYDLSSNAETLL